jgi:hypothetical protein
MEQTVQFVKVQNVNLTIIQAGFLRSAKASDSPAFPCAEKTS